MKSVPGRALSVIAILCLVACAGAAKALAQTAPPQPPPPPLPTQNSLTNVSSMPGPAIGEEFTELSSGVFSYSKTDLSLPGPMPINVTRVYTSNDITSSAWNNRAFGVGTRLNYDMFLYMDGSYESVSMPDSSELKCVLTGSEYTCDLQPSGVWFGSVIDNNVLTRPDGTEYQFDPTTKLLVSITDRFSNSVAITRGPVAENAACQPASGGHSTTVPSGYAASVTSSNGRTVYFCYDSTSYPYDITGIADNASPTIKKVYYTYGAGSVLATVTQNNDPNAITTYQYNQTSPSGVGNITTIITNDECVTQSCTGSNLGQVFTYITYVSNNLGTALKTISSQLPGNGYNYNYNTPSGYPASHVTVTLPDSSTRDFYFDSAGYLTKDVRNVSAAAPEYTVFDRGEQIVGRSEEFVNEVDEEDLNQNIQRKTNYDYDLNTGNILSTTLSPAPGQSSCCATSATWNYTYTTYNRIASFVEPLAYNGVGTTYSYVDPPSTPSMTVTDPLGNALTTTYNDQGQPVSIPNALGNYTTVQYYSNGDVQWVKDPLLNQTSYVTDPDGRVTEVTSPLLENTHYRYDSLDDVTQVTDPSNEVTCHTYDLIGELSSTTPPNGYLNNGNSCPTFWSPNTYTTTITHNPSLTNTKVTYPPINSTRYTTVTDLDGQGRRTDYTDQRGVETTYTYNKFGEVTQALFNANSKSGYSQETVNMSNYDALDRVGQIADTVLTNTITDTFSYDSFNSPLTVTDSFNSGSTTSYDYDLRGRRTSMQVTLDGTAQPVINYGYDCDDRLIGMSNNGSSIQSCDATHDITNGSYSTQFAFNYLGAGVLDWMLSDGVLTNNTVIDSDERVTQRDYYSYPGYVYHSNLNYVYDADGRVIDKNGSLATVNMPAAVSTASYYPTDQVETWSSTSSTIDDASNLTKDPANSLTLTWTARNQMSTASTGATETYDGLGRRESSAGTATLNFEHDGSAMIGWNSTTAGAYNFTTMQGGGPLAGSYTASGTTTTWVPLLDLDGSTLGLLNAANPPSGPVTTYTYDPSGNPTASGAANDWPFQYQGMEKEYTDPGTYYYSGGGQFYSPQLVRSLSETSATSTSGTGGGPAGNSIGTQSVGGGPDVGRNAAIGTAAGAPFGGLAVLSIIWGSDALTAGLATPAAIVGTIVDGLVQLFLDLFGGSSSPPTPRQLLHGRHPLYPLIIGTPLGDIPNQESSGKPELCGDQSVCNVRPLGDDRVLELPRATTPATPTPRPTPTWDVIEHDIAVLREHGEDSPNIERYLEDVDGLPKTLAYPLSLPRVYVPHPYQAIPTPGPTTLEPTLPE